MKDYNHKNIEKKWQENWENEGIYKPNITSAKNKFFNLWMFPYPSAEGVHVGTIFSSTGSDIYGRFMRMNSKDVFQPMGYDSFGIHSENYALKKGENPMTLVTKTVENYERQFKEIGHQYDWSRKVTTSSPDYYKWTQWLFRQLFKQGLAYRAKSAVNWCPGCKTVLADEQITTPAAAGKAPPGYASVEEVPAGIKVCERCGNIPEIKDLEQWFFKITNYADKLLEGLDRIDWSERVVVAQRNWIGRAEGLQIKFPSESLESGIQVWTKYWETIFGATFIVVSPEYLIANLSSSASNESLTYAKQAIDKKAEERRENREKTGVNTGITAVNPATDEQVPVWVADYVIEGVGTGAVMGVPAHDSRDFEFAKKYNLPILQVIEYSNEELNQKVKNSEAAEEEAGALVNSGDFNGMLSGFEGKEAVKKWLLENSFASIKTNYHLRDWLISRQRYWGPPIPMIYCEHCAKEEKGELESSSWNSAGWYSVPEEELPVELPFIEDYQPKGSGRGPLADHPEFYNTTCPGCNREAKRETDVSDTFLDSSWYFLRYPSVDSVTASLKPFDPEITKNWLPVDLYFGGAEHSVLHLMYARFITKVLFDLNLINFDEPFPKFYAHGLMIKDGAKMSKSKGNVVNPDAYIEKFGADTLRLYLMFMGPMDGYPDFRDTGIEGMERFTKRVWNLLNKDTRVEDNGNLKMQSTMHATIKKVTSDIHILHYNTAISSIMEYVNTLSADKDSISRQNLETLALLIAPFAPHLAEEVWREVFKKGQSIHTSSWPEYDEALVVEETAIIPIQVNGKLRAQITVNSTEKDNESVIREKATNEENVKKWIEGVAIKKVIFIPGKILNIIV